MITKACPPAETFNAKRSPNNTLAARPAIELKKRRRSMIAGWKCCILFIRGCFIKVFGKRKQDLYSKTRNSVRSDLAPKPHQLTNLKTLLMGRHNQAPFQLS